MILDLKISSEYRDSLTKYPDEQLDAMTMPVEIPWEPGIASKIAAHPNVKFIVFVPNVRTMATAAERLARGLKFDITTLETGRMALSGKGDKKWKDLMKGLGPVAARGLVLRLVTRAIERGNRVDGFAEIVDDILFNGIHPADADVIGLARNLRSKR
jgi:hypothetical protein